MDGYWIGREGGGEVDREGREEKGAGEQDCLFVCLRESE